MSSKFNTWIHLCVSSVSKSSPTSSQCSSKSFHLINLQNTQENLLKDGNAGNWTRWAVVSFWLTLKYPSQSFCINLAVGLLVNSTNAYRWTICFFVQWQRRTKSTEETSLTAVPSSDIVKDTADFKRMEDREKAKPAPSDKTMAYWIDF